MAILQETRTGLYYVSKDGRILASFERPEDAKAFWEDYKAGAEAPKSNTIEGSKKKQKSVPLKRPKSTIAVAAGPVKAKKKLKKKK